MRKSRRLLAMLLAVMMAISALPLGIFAEETATVQPEPEVGLYWCKYRGVSNNMPVYNADKASDSMQYYTDESVNAVFLFWNGVQFVLLKDKELSFPEGVEHQEMEGGFGGVSLSFPKALTGSIAFTNAVGTYTIDVEVKELSLPVAGFYGECNRSMDTWIGNGRDHVIEGTAKEMKTVYLLWDTEVLKEVSSVALSFEDASNEKDILNNAPLDADTADILAQHGITVTSMLAKGYLQVDTGFVDARNLEIFLTDEDGQTYSAHLSIDEVVSDEEEQPVGRAVDLYWSKFHGMSDGEPVYNADSANDHMWDEVGQDINAVFLFWDGETFSEVPFEELSFPKGLTYSQNKEYANAVYMVFDKALVGDITYTKDGQTYAFPLEVEDLTGEDDEETDEKFTGAVGLYWNYVKLYPDGAPICDISGAKNFMNDYVGQDIDAMFLFWDGETASVVPYELLNIPKTVDYRESEEHSSAVYMKFNTPLEDYITYTRDDVTYQFPLTVKEEEDASDTLVSVGFFDEPVRAEDSWIKKEIISGFSDEIGQAWLMWDTDLFQVDDKGDVLVYLEKNEDEGTELEATIWTDAVDAQLANYGVTLALDVKNQYIEVTADFGKVGGTLDFALTLSDTKGEKTEAQLNIDMLEDPAYTVLKWKPVSEVKGDYVMEDEVFYHAAGQVDEELSMAFFLEEDGDETQIRCMDLESDGDLSLDQLTSDNKYYTALTLDGTGRGAVYLDRYSEKYLPWYTDTADIDENALNAVELLYALDIMIGNANGAFMPNGSVTRAELAKLLYVILNYGDDDLANGYRVTEGYLYCSDVPCGVWFEGYVNYCYDAGLLQGYSDGTFKPNDAVDAETTARALLCAIGYSAEKRGYDDAETGSSAIMADAETIGLLEDVQLPEDQLMTRQWIAKMVENMLLKAYTSTSVDGKLVTELMGEKYLGLSPDSVLYETVYRAIPVEVTGPEVGFYGDRTGKDYLGDELIYRNTNNVVYLLPKEDFTITAVNTIPDQNEQDMSFFKWAKVDGVVEVYLYEGFVEGITYPIVITLQDTDGNTKDVPLEFSVHTDNAVLKWCWVNRENDVYLPQTDYLSEEIWMEPGGKQLLAIYLQQGDDKTLIPYEDLIFKGEGFSVEVNEEDERFFWFCAESSGSGSIRYKASGMTYVLPVTVELPYLGFYSRPERCDDAFMGSTLTYTGENDVYYVILRDEKVIQSVEIVWQDQTVTDDQIRVVIADDGTYAALYLGENVQLDKTHNITVQYSNGSSSRVFRFKDARPGLRWCWVNGNSDNLKPQVDDLRTSLMREITPYGGSWMAFYFVENGKAQLLTEEDLTFPAMLKTEVINENEPGYLYVNFGQLGEGVITYEKDGKTYEMAVEVMLPATGFFNEPVRSEAAYAEPLVIDGKNEEGETVSQETFYLMVEEGWKITDIRPEQGDLSFFSWTVPEGENYAVVTMADGFTDEWYQIRICSEYTEIFGDETIKSTRDESMGFQVTDERPGLRWCWVERNNGECIPQIHELNQNLWADLGSNYHIAIYLCDGEQKTLIPFEKLGYQGNAFRLQALEDWESYINLTSETCGTGKITYEQDGYVYSLPVTVRLPSLGFYTSPEKSEENFVGNVLNYTGDDVYYAMLRWDSKIQRAEVLWEDEPVAEDEIRIDISDDGTYAILYLGKNVRENEHYDIFLYHDGGYSGRSFRVMDSRPGLKWCGVEEDGGVYTPQTDRLESKMRLELSNGETAAVYFCNGQDKTLLAFEKLTYVVSDAYKVEPLEDSAYYFEVDARTCGTGAISYTDENGETYTLPISVELPSVGIYSSDVRSEESYVDTRLSAANAHTDEDGTVCDIYYVLCEPGDKFSKAEVLWDGEPADESEVRIELSEDGSFARLYLYEDVRIDSSYKIYMTWEGGGRWGRSFRVQDERPGLRWVYLRWDDNDNLYEDMEDVRSDLDYSMNDSVRAAFYFVDGDKWERLSPEVLQFPDFLTVKQMEEGPYYVRVGFDQFGSGEVTYERDGVTYTMPASVGLPGMSYYTEPVRSEATYMGDELIFDGKDADGNAVTKETFYLMVQDGWNITKLEFTERQPDFFSYEIVDGYAVVTISEGFQESRWEVKAHCQRKDNPNNTDWWWADFSVQDNRPGLKWKWVDFGGDGQFPFVPEDEEFQSVISHRMDSGVTVAVYYVDGDTEVLIPKKKLILPDFVEIEPNTDAEGGDYFFWLSFLAVGEGEITCADYPGCGLPVVSELPFIALYSQPEAKEEYLLNSKNLSLDFSEEAEDGRRYATVYIVPAQEDWTLTGLQMGGNGNDDPMNFVDYAVNKAENYIELKVYDEYLPDWYSLKVYHTYPDGEKGDRWVEFRLADKPILQWMQVMEADGSYAITGGSRSLSLQPGESQLMAVCYTYNNDMVPLDYDDLIFPDFLSVERLDEDDPTLLRVLSTGLGEGSITSKTYPDLRLRVVSSREMLGYYTLPELNGDALNNRLNSVDGQDIVRWLIWDPAQLPDVTDVTLTLKNEEHTILVDDVRASSADLSQWGITVTLDLEAGHMKLVAKEGDWYNLTAKVWQDEDYERITVNLNSDPNEWGHIWDDGLPVIWYEGVPYSFFIAMGEEDMDRVDDVGNFGSSGGGTHDSKLVIGAMGWYGTDKEEEAPEEVLNAIKNVQFRIGKFHNFDASGDQMECNFKEPENIECNLHGKTLHGIYTETYDGMYVYAEFIATFTVELPGMEPQTFTMNTIGHRLPDRSIDLDMTSLTTAAELNAVLSSGDALMTWVKANQPKVYAQFKALEAIEGRAMFARFSATLAPVVFEDVIVVSNEYVCLNLSGSVDEEGNRTTMPGMWLKNHDTSFIEGIDFVADAGKTMTWGKKKAFTCGVLAGGEDRNSGDAYGGDAYGVDDCTFTGFDYGIRCTEYSYTAPGRGCTFVDCEYGYYVDCGKKTGGNANSDVTYCRFINCDTAIRIKSLPNYVSPYDLVISNNDFINNKWDIDLSVRGRFFFNGNYYGETADGSALEVRADCIYRTARVHGRGYATIIVNPRWQLPCTFSGPNKLVMDIHKGLNNYMINENADKNPIDSKTLAYDLGLYTEAELLRIIMTDDSENTLGTWTFSGTKDSESLSLLDAAEVNDTFNAELVFGEDAAGNPTVTIQDSSALSGGNVKLTVPCSFWDAKVTVNGQEVDASVANGQVTFTVIGGGTYVIHEVELEEIEDAFITGGAAESNPDAGDEPVTQPKAEVDMGWYNYDHSETGEDTAPKFATVTTEDQQVAKEIDPDADLDDVVEGEEKVEEKTETTQIVTVQAIYQAPAAAEPGDTVSDVVVLLVLYDQSGQMIAMHQQVAQQNDGTRVITVQCDAALLSSNAVTVKAFVISASGDMRPLAPVPFSQTLTFNEN